jgi:hypothetical protein
MFCLLLKPQQVEQAKARKLRPCRSLSRPRLVRDKPAQVALEHTPHQADYGVCATHARKCGIALRPLGAVKNTLDISLELQSKLQSGSRARALRRIGF